MGDLAVAQNVTVADRHQFGRPIKDHLHAFGKIKHTRAENEPAADEEQAEDLAIKDHKDANTDEDDEKNDHHDRQKDREMVNDELLRRVPGDFHGPTLRVDPGKRKAEIWDFASPPFLSLCGSLCGDLINLLMRRLQGRFRLDRHAIRVNDLHIRDADEAHDVTQVGGGKIDFRVD